MKSSVVLAGWIVVCVMGSPCFAQEKGLNLKVAPGPVLAGTEVRFGLDAPGVLPGSALYLVIGTAQGTSTVTLGQQTFALPLAGQILVLSLGTPTGRGLSGSIPIPNDPALYDLVLPAIGICVPPEGLLMISPLVPIGPIIEDAIT